MLKLYRPNEKKANLLYDIQWIELRLYHFFSVAKKLGLRETKS